jgi:prolyl-tRNA editing enzyme YbaK/EbsC (Cys-tRNA(Pro) deacylase)
VASVIEFLLDHGTPFLALPAPRATSIEDTARANGIGMDEVVRSELVISRMGPSLMVFGATRSLDLGLVRKAVQDESARTANEQEIRSLAPDCDVDSLPPLSLYLSAPMFVDPSVAAMEQVVFPGGRRTVLVCVERAELFGEGPSVIVALTRESYVPGERVAPSRRAALEEGERLLPEHLRRNDDRPGQGGRRMIGR